MGTKLQRYMCVEKQSKQISQLQPRMIVKSVHEYLYEPNDRIEFRKVFRGFVRVAAKGFEYFRLQDNCTWKNLLRIDKGYGECTRYDLFLCVSSYSAEMWEFRVKLYIFWHSRVSPSSCPFHLVHHSLSLALYFWLILHDSIRLLSVGTSKLEMSPVGKARGSGDAQPPAFGVEYTLYLPFLFLTPTKGCIIYMYTPRNICIHIYRSHVCEHATR